MWRILDGINVLIAGQAIGDCRDFGLERELSG
jgi:hypothetical protein